MHMNSKLKTCAIHQTPELSSKGKKPSEARKTYLSPPFSGFRSTVNSLNHGNIIYLMYSRHGFFSTTLGGQKAFFIFTLTSACEIHSLSRQQQLIGKRI